MFTTILFDLDGTLTDPYEGITKSIQYALASIGTSEPQENLKRFIGPPLHTALHEVYGFDDAQVAAAMAKYRERFSVTGLFENEVYPLIPQLLAKLQENGVILAIASSKPEVYVKQIAVHFNLDKYFTEMVGSELDGTRSKKGEEVAEALRRLGADPKTTLMVGDRMHDMHGGKENGLATAGVYYGYATPGELEAAGADFIAHTVAELSTILLENI